MHDLKATELPLFPVLVSREIKALRNTGYIHMFDSASDRRVKSAPIIAAAAVAVLAADVLNRQFMYIVYLSGTIPGKSYGSTRSLWSGCLVLDLAMSHK